MNLFTPIIGLALVLNLMPEGSFGESMAKFLANLAVGIGVSLFVTIGLFLAMMEEKFRKTFLNVETGK